MEKRGHSRLSSAKQTFQPHHSARQNRSSSNEVLFKHKFIKRKFNSKNIALIFIHATKQHRVEHSEDPREDPQGDPLVH